MDKDSVNNNINPQDKAAEADGQDRADSGSGGHQDMPPPVNISKGMLRLVGVLIAVFALVFVMVFGRHIGDSQVKGCTGKRRAAEVAYFEAGMPADFAGWAAASLEGKAGSCPQDSDSLYYWDDQLKTVACPEHKGPVFPVTARPEDGTNMRMLMQSIEIYAALTELPERDGDGAIALDNEAQADFWKGYFEWMGGDFIGETSGDLRFFFEKTAQGYSDTPTAVYYKIRSAARMYFADGTLVNGEYGEFIVDGQLTPPAQ